MTYEKLLKEAAHRGIDIYEEPMKPKIKGLYCDNIIWINRFTPTLKEKACILAEELGHYYTSAGNILDQTKTENRKQERCARAWAYKRLIPLSSIVQAYQEGIRNRYEFAEYLDVTEEFLDDALKWYQEKFGLYVPFGDYTIYFDPLRVL